MLIIGVKLFYQCIVLLYLLFKFDLLGELKKIKLSVTNGYMSNQLHGCVMSSGCQSLQWLYLNYVEVRKKRELSVVENDKINCSGILFMFVQEYLGKLEWHDLLVQTDVLSSERPYSNLCEISFFLFLNFEEI